MLHLQKKKITQYVIYAIGEILLVVIGILIAMNVDDWNEEKRRKENFLISMEQIYNMLDMEIQTLEYTSENLQIQFQLIDSMLRYRDLIDPKRIPGYLIYIESLPAPSQTSLGYMVEQLKVHPDNKEESMLVRNLTDYVMSINNRYEVSDQPVTDLLIREELPTPFLLFGVSYNMSEILLDGFYDEHEIRKCNELLKTKEMRIQLYKAAMLKNHLKVKTDHQNDIAHYVKNQVKLVHPKVKLLYENLSLLGTGTVFQDWSTDIFLKQTDVEKVIWQSEVTELNGELKFRENGNWNRNWGGDTFPTGKLVSGGKNLNIPAGQYIVTINLTDKTYAFERVGE